jgi:histidine triad (HIT) family protein
MNCLFCKIVAKEIPGKIIYEDDSVLGLLDINPRSPGHTMVVPKFHAENILDLPDDRLAGVFLAVKKVTELLKSRLSPDGFTIGINHGKVSGQMVEHLHIHIMPRWAGDGGSSVHSVVDNPPKVSVDEIMKKILK